MGRCLGFDHIHYHNLERIIARIGMAAEFERKPLMVVTKGASSNIIRNATLAGFDVVRTLEKGADDAHIIQWLAAVDPTTVDEIILVSADSDFIPMMEEKTRQGIRTYWVTSKNVWDTNGHPIVGNYLLSFFDKIFTFIELDAYREEVFYNQRTAVRA